MAGTFGVCCFLPKNKAFILANCAIASDYLITILRVVETWAGATAGPSCLGDCHIGG